MSSASKNPGASLPEDDFEFIDTPTAPSPAPESANYGVRTTSVRHTTAIGIHSRLQGHFKAD